MTWLDWIMSCLPRRDPIRDLPQSFGYKNSWYALATSDTDAVIDSLGLIDAKPSNWSAGIKAAYNYQVFVTPPLGQWTLVVGFLLGPSGELALTIKPTLERLASTFSEAQFYSTHRVVEYHVWAKAQYGQLVRAYAYLGESGQTLWDEGPLTPEERALGFAFFDERSPQAEDEDYWERADLTFPNEGCVMQIAGRWSICPAELEGKFIEPSLGVICRMTRGA